MIDKGELYESECARMERREVVRMVDSEGEKASEDGCYHQERV